MSDPVHPAFPDQHPASSPVLRGSVTRSSDSSSPPTFKQPPSYFFPLGYTGEKMASTDFADETNNGITNKEMNDMHNVNGYDHAPGQNGAFQRRPYDYGGNPLAHVNTGGSVRLPAFGGEFQPGLYKNIADRKFANPAPLGLSAFALTTFVLSLINLGTEGLTGPSIVIAPAFAYGGLVQLLAGMW